MITWLQLGLQDSSSSIIEEFTFFHDYIIITLIFIITIVLTLIIFIYKNTLLRASTLENQILETIWTLIPALILINLAIPSLSLLYILEEDSEHSLRVKALGHQWYWSYEIREIPSSPSFDRYIAPENERMPRIRLLDVDNRLTLPFNTPIRILISSIDVLHSWTVPALGVKADACPGRLNQVNLIRLRPGVFFGQCSEICGANHRFMPIVMEATAMSDFLVWAR